MKLWGSTTIKPLSIQFIQLSIPSFKASGDSFSFSWNEMIIVALIFSHTGFPYFKDIHGCFCKDTSHHLKWNVSVVCKNIVRPLLIRSKCCLIIDSVGLIQTCIYDATTLHLYIQNIGAWYVFDSSNTINISKGISRDHVWFEFNLNWNRYKPHINYNNATSV